MIGSPGEAIGLDGIRGETILRRRLTMVSTPLQASIERARELGRPFLDEKQRPYAARLRALGITCEVDDIGNGLVPMARILVAENGGGVRTFAGNLNHVVGWWPSYKARRLLHFEGTAARSLIIANECEHSTITMMCEPMTFEIRNAETSFSYTPDFLIERADGVRVLFEAKANEGDLRKQEYRRKLGIVAEICRRLGWIFQVVLEDEIFQNRTHRKNCGLVASHRFVRVDPSHLVRLSKLAEPLVTYGELANVLDPHSAASGRAIAHALHVRGLVEIELGHWLQDYTPVRIHASEAQSRKRGRSAKNAIPRPAFA